MKVLVHEWVTGGGLAGSPMPRGLTAEGGAMRRALAEDFAAVDGVEVVMMLDERFGTERLPQPGQSVLVGQGEELATLAALAAECDHTVVVAPETGGILAERAALVGRSGGKWLGSSVEAIRATSDKLALANHLLALGIPTPLTARYYPKQLETPPWAPAIIKPIDGAGSEHTYLVDNVGSFVPPRDFPSEMVVQEYRRGEPMSASFLVGRDGEVVLLAVGWQSIENTGGVIQYEGGRLPAPRARATGAPLRAVRSVEGLRGFVGVDFVWDGGTNQANVIEINPRVSTSYAGLVHYHGRGMIARIWLGLVAGNLSEAQAIDMLSNSGGGDVTFLADGTLKGRDHG